MEGGHVPPRSNGWKECTRTTAFRSALLCSRCQQAKVLALVLIHWKKTSFFWLWMVGWIVGLDLCALGVHVRVCAVEAVM
jgi:hypothetical protein